MDKSVEDVELALLEINEEIVYTMEYEFENADDKDDACSRFDRMFEARPSLLTGTVSGRGESVYNACENYISDGGKIIMRIV